MQDIFDEIVRTEIRAGRHNESHFAYLNTTARPQLAALRPLVEEWFSRFPQRHRNDLRPRLRSTDNNHFLAAFFELFLYTLSFKLGYRIRIHPRAGSRGGRPDFLLRQSTDRPILLEAATLEESSQAERGARTRLSAAFDALNTLACPDYFLRVEHAGTPNSLIPERRLKAQVQSFLKTLDYDTIRESVKRAGLDAPPTTVFEHAGCRLEVGVIPVSPGRRGAANHRPLGTLMPSEASIVDDRTPLRDKIRAKANRYGHIRRPLLIAVNASGRQLDKIDIMEALFGKEAFTFPTPAIHGPGEPEMTPIPDGAWAGPSGPRNTRVAAVLVFSSLLPWTITVTQPALYVNPWAKYPLPDGPLDQLETHKPVGNRMVATGGRPIHEILGLPERWPHDLPSES